MGLKAALYNEIDVSARSSGVSRFNQIICAIIIFAVINAILETEQPLVDRHTRLFEVIEWSLFVVFAIEYCLRLYVAPLNPQFSGRYGRLRYIVSIWSIIDLLALLPFLLTAFGSTSFYLRAARLLRILRVARLGRFTSAWTVLGQAIGNRKFELMLGGLAALLLLLVSSTLLYIFEADGQPEAFGSIPRALWWSVATLTTVGYGDVTPASAAGRFFASLTAVAGIGLVAMPAGILAAAFSDAFQKQDPPTGD